MAPGAELFLDTSYAIALSSRSDESHQRARALAQKIVAERIPLVTSRAVLVEIGNALSKLRHRDAAARLLTAIETDPTVRVVPLSDDLYADGLALFGDRRDKEWSLTDCISFVLMDRLGVRDALTADHHFEQAGFTAMLRYHP